MIDCIFLFLFVAIIMSSCLSHLISFPFELNSHYITRKIQNTNRQAILYYSAISIALPFVIFYFLHHLLLLLWEIVLLINFLFNSICQLQLTRHVANKGLDIPLTLPGLYSNFWVHWKYASKVPCIALNCTAERKNINSNGLLLLLLLFIVVVAYCFIIHKRINPHCFIRRHTLSVQSNFSV